MPPRATSVRSLGLFGATGVGVGAIVGGGILALAGVGFSSAGPGAIVAFLLNGAIAMFTALSFAEMSAAFPESGGTYTFAKKVLNVRLAFGVGWVVWFASLVAAVLYALGFASFALLSLQELWARFVGHVPAWLNSRIAGTVLAVASTAYLTFYLMRTSGGGGQWINVTKSVVFVVVIGGGLWAVARSPSTELSARLLPFFPFGLSGLFQAMGFTFIALQGFDLIAAVAGEVKDPARNIPRAMIGSLAVALAIYIPLLFVVAGAGVGPGERIVDLAKEQPEGVVAFAARRFLGDFGYWLVIAAGLLSMWSALQANLFAASRVGFAMGRDRTLGPTMGHSDPKTGIPSYSVGVTGAIVVAILVFVPDVATAGAASSLIFLVTFALAHYINILMHQRLEPSSLPFVVRGFPFVPIAGGMACMGLAFFQGVSVPVAGVVTVMWLTAGVGLFTLRFAGRAETFDATAEGADPALTKYRGRNPLVLLPVSDTENAASLVAVANALCPPGFGRVLLLCSLEPPAEWKPKHLPESLLYMSQVLREAVNESFAGGLAPEAMMTVAENRWREVGRVARLHRCESLLLGFSKIGQLAAQPGFNELVTNATADVVLMRIPRGFQFHDTRRVLVPLGGRGMHSALRGRLLGALRRQVPLDVTYLCLVKPEADRARRTQAETVVHISAEDEMGGEATTLVEQSGDPVSEIARRSHDYDLLILGLQQSQDRRRAIGDFTLGIADSTDCALIVIGHKRDEPAFKLPNLFALARND